MHEKILRDSSTYFNTLLNSDFIETATREVTLDRPADSVDAFDKSVQYMYSSQQQYTLPTTTSKSKNGLAHARVFVMAHRLCMDNLEIYALWRFSYELETSYPNPWNTERLCQTVKLIYRNTPTPDKMSYPEGKGESHER